MCCGVRCTVSRATPSSRMWARVFTARRSRRSFLVVLMLGYNLEPLLLLAFLHDDLLARVPHALALVGLGWTHVADLGSHLSDFLHVDTLDDDLRLTGRLDGDALRDRVLHRMRKPERQVQGLALHRGAKADAHELELALVALRHARHHVREMRAGGARDHREALAVAVLHAELLLFLHHRHAARDREIERPLGALDGDRFGSDRGCDALRQIDDSVRYT